jgi:predicted nucleotidyltransferase component of viral defense system
VIRDAEIRRIAGRAGVEPRIVELDYALGWALRGIAGHASLSRRLVFKGGTCLRKCYFPGYRFSEDLDFTATGWSGWKELEESVREAFTEAAQASGIDFAARDPKLRILEDEYGRETLRVRIYWRGPHERRGSPPGLRLDITRNEVLAFDPVPRDMAHPFSDAEELGGVALICYSLEEVMAEKVRAVLGQRIHAVSRDLYDIFRLRERVDEGSVMRALPTKMAAREVEVEAGDLPRRLTDRKAEFEADWERNLSGLLPPGAEVEFDHAWERVLDYVTRMSEGLDLDRQDETAQ